jgi:hypothetical protein
VERGWPQSFGQGGRKRNRPAEEEFRVDDVALSVSPGMALDAHRHLLGQIAAMRDVTRGQRCVADSSLRDVAKRWADGSRVIAGVWALIVIMIRSASGECDRGDGLHVCIVPPAVTGPARP